MDLPQYIDLDSYSSSPGFLGYTERKADFSEAGINALCDDFIEKMAPYMGEVTVASSLFICKSKAELSKDHGIPEEVIERMVSSLEKYDLVKWVDPEKLPPPELPQFDEEFRKFETKFNELHTPDAETLKGILGAYFHAVGVQGHLFIVFHRAEVIVYPHADDLGFGFISINKGCPGDQNKSQNLLRAWGNEVRMSRK